jgi:hypothetical protein
MKVLVKFNKNISTPKQVRTFKVFDLGVVTSTLNDLLNDSIIEIDDLTLPILKIKKDDVYNYYLINDLGKTNNFVNPYYTDDFTKDINLEDLILINTSFNDVITKHSELILDDGTNPHGTTKNDVGLGNVPNLDTTNAVNNSHIHSNKSILDLITEPFTTSLKSLYDSAVTNINNLLLTGDRLITSSEITKLSNTSGINTGDETTESIQIKRPLKTINNQSLEGNGNIDIETANNFPYTEITKAELDTLIANSELTKGFYKISGVNPTLYGGTTILVEVLEDNKLPIDAYGLFFNPKYDKTIDGFGVAKDYAFWKDESEQLESGVYTIGENVIWGGKHWICVAETDINTKYIVDKFNLSTDYFEEVPFNDTDYNLVLDKINYDYEHDLIIERNEKNSNIVSFSYDSLTLLSSILNGDLALDNPIKNFQWGNLFDYDFQKGIGNNKVNDSLNENINFTGRYQLGLFFSSNNNQSRLVFKNNAIQYNLYFSKESSQINLIFGNNSYQSGLTFSNSSGQINLIFGNNSGQSGLTFSNSSYQNNLVLNDSVSQNNLVFNNYQRDGITISENEENLTFDGNQHATKLTGNEFFTGKTTNDFAQIGDINNKADLVDGKVPAAQSQPSTMEMNNSTYVITFTDATGSVQTIDLPIESLFRDANYDSETKKLILTLDSGDTIEVSLEDLVDLPEIQIENINPSVSPSDGKKVYFNISNGKIYLNYQNEWAFLGNAISDTEKSNINTAYIHLQATGNPHNTTKADIGLGNVDNTSDLNKPISNATQNALNLKENSSNKVTDFTSPNNTTFPTTQAIINENKKATITVELINLLTTSFYAPNALRINSTALINGSGTIALKVNDVAYTLGNLIAQGAKITVETTTASVYNLIVIYE